LASADDGGSGNVSESRSAPGTVTVSDEVAKMRPSPVSRVQVSGQTPGGSVVRSSPTAGCASPPAPGRRERWPRLEAFGHAPSLPSVGAGVGDVRCHGEMAADERAEGWAQLRRLQTGRRGSGLAAPRRVWPSEGVSPTGIND